MRLATAIQVRNALVLIRADAFDSFVLGSAAAVAKRLGVQELTILVLHTTPPPSFALGEEPHLELPREDGVRIVRTDLAGDAEMVVPELVVRHRIDLVIAAEAGMTTQRLLRAIPCALLIVPQCDVEPRGPLLVPVDRDNIRLATLQFASNLSRVTNQPLEILNIYSVPVGYHKMGKSYGE